MKKGREGGRKIRKGKIKLPLFSHSMIIHTEKSQEICSKSKKQQKQKLLEQICEFKKVVRFKANTEKPTFNCFFTLKQWTIGNQKLKNNTIYNSRFKKWNTYIET
ncbi:unnamed protein product [Pipistrellus nathusii]|uniref:Uncharacterized protein n=1 Tax=Pipistrellus nathusii TaxID=59473 RepID=A0ABN9ZSV4_PIPNA